MNDLSPRFFGVSKRWERSRREFLRDGTVLLGGLAWAPLAGCAGARASGSGTAVYLVPGYRTDVAAHRGRSAAASPELRRSLPHGYQGRVTLLTRVSERDGSVSRALLPINGHAVCVDPSGQRAFWNSMNEPSFLSLDPLTLELDVLAQPHAADFIGAGHAKYTADGGALLVVERKRYGQRKDVKPEEQYGKISVRDPGTLRVLELIDCHGVSPHDLEILADGKYVAIANYGSTNVPDPGERPQMLEPSLTVVELATGRLVYKKIGPEPGYEVRHLTAHRLDRIAAILVREGTEEDGRRLMEASDGVYEPDLSAEAGYAYLPAPVQHYDATHPSHAPIQAMADDPILSRHGQSIVYEPTHDEVIATFATSHCVAVYAGGSGRLKRLIRTDRIGLRYPRGIGLHPDGRHYAVAGSWSGIYLFRRGDHASVPERTLHPVFFDHSHLAILG